MKKKMEFLGTSGDDKFVRTQEGELSSAHLLAKFKCLILLPLSGGPKLDP